MSEQVNLWIIDRQGDITQEPIVVSRSTIQPDYITQDSSEFELPETATFVQGDFVLAKVMNSESIVYFGVVSSYEDNKLIANDILNLVNFEFPATRMTGSSFEQHFKNLVNRYLLQDTTKDLSILDIDVKTNTSHIYQPAEPPTATNLMKYAINAFKKYNIVWRFDRFENGRIKTVIEAVTDSISFKDNIVDLQDWEVSTTEVGKNTENHLMIVNKNTTNSEGPNILAERYLTTENEITSAASNPNISKPTKTKVAIFDTTATSNPTYDELANSELKGNFYSHEITFTMSKDNEFLPFYKMKLGTLATIFREGKMYKSVLTGYEYASDSNRILMKFGHVKSRLSELLE
ncbi:MULTISPECIES: hypothetical protein [unclassified Enterococcus]|uniref:hypothetical protein n=1 Tax=unclassified Enterococcus TaxID=2608891 RepID=UPI001556E572|nr:MULTISPECIES: hypothetical protein [unclassified Enterococcus]MBS7578288.1 hypothetical protein [Enterococcus sp. MMGLQ5-2]MBS7585501.1 hypothetical protein [Enterococcus sp. MMGLQ5-1]NPD13358.1 hypothetical protein [Enterococcus sp. MMGLQ5-1]NPD38119.1 hypothetical protein [Enterococcus sp. MMGLQ5-2]